MCDGDAESPVIAQHPLYRIEELSIVDSVRVHCYTYVCIQYRCASTFWPRGPLSTVYQLQIVTSSSWIVSLPVDIKKLDNHSIRPESTSDLHIDTACMATQACTSVFCKPQVFRWWRISSITPLHTVPSTDQPKKGQNSCVSTILHWDDEQGKHLKLPLNKAFASAVLTLVLV